MKSLHPHWREAFARAAREAQQPQVQAICPTTGLACKIPAACVIASGLACRFPRQEATK